MTLLWIYLGGIVVTAIVIAIGCRLDPYTRCGLRKVEFGKVVLGTIFWPIFWIFAIFFIGRE